MTCARVEMLARALARCSDEMARHAGALPVFGADGYFEALDAARQALDGAARSTECERCARCAP